MSREQSLDLALLLVATVQIFLYQSEGAHSRELLKLVQNFLGELDMDIRHIVLGVYARV